VSRFSRSLDLPVSAAELFAWHERPGALERLSPGWQRVDLVEHTGGIRDGARVVLRVYNGPLPMRWELAHEHYIEGARFEDVQRRGPFARWRHVHRFESRGAHASTLHDEIEYALPFGPLGALVGGPFMERMLRRLFAHRHAVTQNDIERHRPFASRAPLRIAITGATGLIGSALTAFLTTGGHTVTRIRRAAGSGREMLPSDVLWDPSNGTLDPRRLEGFDAIVHLAGEPVEARWSAHNKRGIRDSRVLGTQLLANAIASLERPPKVLVSASAIGFYGDRGEELLDETSGPGRGFLAGVVQEWEAATAPAEAAGIRVVHSRTGVVLSPRGGALVKLLPPFRLGMGGKIGDGKQWMSCIALDDVVGAMHYAIMTESLRGPMNVVMPQPVTNEQFGHTLGHVLHRPSLATVPPMMVKMVLGAEQAEEMALASQRIVPRALERAGFVFRHPSLEDGLRFELGRE
jgi:hypothetical protein